MKRQKISEPPVEAEIDLSKARQEKENAKIIPSHSSDFMSDVVIKKSLIEREQDKLRKAKDKLVEQEIKERRGMKDIVMSFDLN